MTRLLGLALAAVLLAMLATALLVDGALGDRLPDPRPLAALDELVRTHASLQPDMLPAWAGDAARGEALAADAERLNRSVRSVREGIRQARLDERTVDLLAYALGDEQALIRRLDGRPASVRNALAGFPAQEARLPAEAVLPALPVPALPAQMAALDRSRLSLCVGASPLPSGPGVPGAAEAARASIDTFASPAPSDPASAAPPRHFPASAERLAGLLAEPDGPVRQTAAGAVNAAVAAVRTQLDRHAAQSLRRERDSHLALCAASLVLAAVAAHLLARLRGSLLELEYGAEQERAAVRVSTLLFCCEPERTGEALTSALAIIGHSAGLDGVTVVLSDPNGLYRWARDPLQPGPPAPLLLGILEEVAGGLAGRVAPVPQTSSAAGPAARRLNGCGVCAWAGRGLRRRERTIGLVSFEVTRRRRGGPFPDAGLLEAYAEMMERALERQRIAAERETMQARSLHAQRLQAAGALASGLAHNFNNIVGAVVGHAEMAAHCVGRGTSPLAHVDEIRRAAERAGELIETMLSLNRRNLPQQEVVVSALVTETMSLLQVSLPPGILLCVEDAGGDTTVLGRTAELQQVLLNLVRNAAQASPDGGRVTVGLACVVLSMPRHLATGSLAAGRYVVVSVSDTGKGMDQATLARAFEPFFSTRPAGTGLGLATAADIVRELGGAIDVLSTVNAGTDFDVWLPSAGDRGPSHRAGAGRGQGEVILVIEADQERLLRSEDTLAALGYEPAGVTSPQAATDAIDRAPHLHDAALIGLAPGDTHDVIEVCARLLASRPGLPLVVVGDEDRLLDRLHAEGMRTVVVIGPGQGALTLASALGRLLDHGLSRGEVRVP